jgi:hypothetical protein
LEFVIGDAGFENWLVNRVLGWLSERGFRLPEFVVCELQLVSDGVRLRLLEVAETEDGDYGVVGVLYESNYSHQEMLYLYGEYLEERAARLRPPPRYEGSPLQEIQG